jgi:hypothetical protein
MQTSGLSASKTAVFLSESSTAPHFELEIIDMVSTWRAPATRHAGAAGQLPASTLAPAPPAAAAAAATTWWHGWSEE